MRSFYGRTELSAKTIYHAEQTTILHQFAGLSLERIPDKTTIPNFLRLPERHELAAGILTVINGYLGDRDLSLRQGTIVDATLLHAPSSTKTRCNMSRLYRELLQQQKATFEIGLSVAHRL